MGTLTDKQIADNARFIFEEIEVQIDEMHTLEDEWSPKAEFKSSLKNLLAKKYLLEQILGI